MAKKSFNPFKMWGSYVGAILASFLPAPIPLSPILGGGGFANGYKIIIFCLTEGCRTNATILFGVGIIIGWSIIGFLIGWGIHLLVRASRR